MPGSRFTDFREHTIIFKGSNILKINCRLLMLKIAQLRDSNRLVDVFFARDSITNTNNSVNVLKNLKLFFGKYIR
jgi:hypothetical protein